MLNSHKNLLASRPSDRLRIGDSMVDLSTREVSHSGGQAPTRITLKSAGVLLVLVANAGRVVSREALLEWVWPDTMPTDDVVTQAITQLRKALGNAGATPPCIETISKQGYRLLAPVEWIVDESDQAASAVPEALPVGASPRANVSAKGANRYPAWTLAGACLVLAFAGWFYWKTPRSVGGPVAAIQAASVVPFRRATSSPVSERWPSLSPDGAVMVYSQFTPDGTSVSLRLQTTAAVSQRPLTDAAEEQYDMFPSWSPDGREIAFSRSTETSCKLMLVPATGGSTREIGPCLGGRAHPVAWYPDGTALIGAPVPMATYLDPPVTGLHRMRLDAGQWVLLRYTRAASDVDTAPRVSPDGRWIVFQRNISLGDLWKISVAGGAAQRVTRLRENIFSFDWIKDGSGLVLSRYGQKGPELAKLDFATGKLANYADRSATFTNPVVARNGDVAFMIDDARSTIGRFILDSRATPYSPLFEATTSNLLPGIAPDGKQLAFISDRTGDRRLWWVDQGVPDSLRSIDKFVPVPRHPVQWDEASSKFLAIGHWQQDLGVYEVEAGRGQARRLPVPDTAPVHAAYHADPGKLLVVADRGEGRLGLTLYDRTHQPWRVLARIDDVATAYMDRLRRRIVFTRMSASQVWQADEDLSNPVLLDTVDYAFRLRTLVVAPAGLWVMDAREGCDWYWREIGAAGKRAGSCLTLPPTRQLEGLSYSQKDRALYLSINEESATDIGLLPLTAFDGGAPVPAH